MRGINTQFRPECRRFSPFANGRAHPLRINKLLWPSIATDTGNCSDPVYRCFGKKNAYKKAHEKHIAFYSDPNIAKKGVKDFAHSSYIILIHHFPISLCSRIIDSLVKFSKNTIFCQVYLCFLITLVESRPAVVEPRQEIASRRCSLPALCCIMLLASFYLAPCTHRTCAVAHPRHDGNTYIQAIACPIGSPQTNSPFSIFKQTSKRGRCNFYCWFIEISLFISFYI